MFFKTIKYHIYENFGQDLSWVTVKTWVMVWGVGFVGTFASVFRREKTREGDSYITIDEID